MSVINLHLEDDLTALLHESNQPVQKTVREFVVLELYRRGTISSGKAAQSLGMSRGEFIHHASRLGVAFFEMTSDEWQSEKSQIDSLCPELP